MLLKEVFFKNIEKNSNNVNYYYKLK